MAKNTGTDSRTGSVTGRTQVENPKTGDWVKRDESKDSSHKGEFMDVEEDGMPFKGVAKEPDGRRTKNAWTRGRPLEISAETYEPSAFVDEEKQRIMAAVERKVQGKEIITHEHATQVTADGGAVVDLMAALRASLNARPASGADEVSPPTRERQPARRANSSGTKTKSKRSA